MTLYIIGLGLDDPEDISVKSFKIIKQCDKIYLENYTSLLQCSTADLEKFYGKKIIISNREMTELGMDRIVAEAKDQNVVFLVIGDPFSATTHIELFKSARENNIPVKVINNASILTAVGITGLQLYKFGKTTSIPFIDDLPNLETPYNIIKENREKGSHTLCLLDIQKDKERFMTISQALKILEEIEERKKEKVITDELLIVGCARLGSVDFVVKAGKISELKEFAFGKPPHALIISGKLHFLEEEMLEFWKKN